MGERKSRRRFLAEGALALVGAAAVRADEARAAPDAGTTASSAPSSPAPGAPPAVTPDDFAHAERLERVTMTASQRALAAESWEFNVGSFFARRDFPLGSGPTRPPRGAGR